MTDNKGSFPVIHRETLGKCPGRSRKEQTRSFIHLLEFSAPLPALGRGWNRAIYSALPAALVPCCACCFLHKKTVRRRVRGAAAHQTPASFPLEPTLQWRPTMHDGLGARPAGAAHFPPCSMPSCSCFVLPSGFPELYGCPNDSWWDRLREQCIHHRPQHPPKALRRCTCRASHWGHGAVAAESCLSLLCVTSPPWMQLTETLAHTQNANSFNLTLSALTSTSESYSQKAGLPPCVTWSGSGLCHTCTIMCMQFVHIIQCFVTHLHIQKS